MAQQTTSEDSVTALKRNLLLHWALLPPANQILRPVNDLVCNIHLVFPPAFGVPNHRYFGGWKEINPHELIQAGTNRLDEDKLKKAVRKVRFFLHPDRLPRDLTADQHFACKLLWDVTNDAWEDHKKNKEELDWVG